MAAIVKEQIDALRKTVDVLKNERDRVKPALRTVHGQFEARSADRPWASICADHLRHEQ